MSGGSHSASSYFTDLLVIHPRHVVIERGHLFATLGGVVSEKLGELRSVCRVLVDAKLQVLGEGFVKLFNERAPWQGAKVRVDHGDTYRLDKVPSSAQKVARTTDILRPIQRV